MIICKLSELFGVTLDELVRAIGGIKGVCIVGA